MQTISMLDDLYRYNAWANLRAFELAADLSDDALDAAREMGMGSLRETLLHLVRAEEIWLSRWKGLAPAPVASTAERLSVEEIRQRFLAVDAARDAFLAAMGDEDRSTPCQYQDLKGNDYRHPLNELLVHVVNHGIHHRAQALHFLKRAGRTIAGGLDYVFYRLARPSLAQEPEAVSALRGRGLEVATSSSPALTWDAKLVRHYFNYNDWAHQKLWPLVKSLSADQLDHDHGIGMGSVRKTLLHVLDAERFWLRNWTVGPSPWEGLPTGTSLTAIEELWRDTIPARNTFIGRLDGVSAGQSVSVQWGGPPLRVPIAESMLQLCGHGTHHRAQLRNMLRHSGGELPPLDYVAFLREQA